MRCPSCGVENRAEARFCDSCGATLAPAPTRDQRKTVSVLFCDVSGSTALGERLDPETVREVMGRYFGAARVAIERHGGTLEKFIGDAVMAVFGVPVVHEDDALRAVRAALELRDAVEIDVRIGVNTGEVVTGGGDSLVTGDAVNVAARLEQAASPGEVLLGAATYALVRDAVDAQLLPPLEAKGKSEPLTAYRLVAVTGDAAFARRADVPLVGREREQRLLADAWERAVSERACVLFTVLGAAGVGKSRLTADFVDGLDATVAGGRCLSYGEGITYWPVVEIVKKLLGPERPPPGALAALLGDGNAAADEIAVAVRRLLEQQAAERPLVLVLDDLQWAEPTFLDLVEHVSDWSRDAPILLLCLARPDLLEVRGGWGGGKLNATTVLLESLSGAEADALIDELLAGGQLEPALRERIREAAEGNPLFLEQMLAVVQESPDEVVVPASIQALLSARLDQLPTAERAALQRGAVEGQVFHRGAVQALAPDDLAVPSHLLGLVRKELVRPTSATLPGDDAFRFRHLLIRDAAYDALPKATRADLHQRFAAWLESHAPDLVELDEILGYHLEQAALYRRGLLREDGELSVRAASRLGAAGLRAAGRQDVNAGRSLLERAVALLPADAPERWPFVVELGRMLYEANRLVDAERVLTEAVEEAGRDDAARAFFFRAYMLGHASGEGLGAREQEVRERLVGLRDVDDSTLAEGHLTLAQLSFWLGRYPEAVEAGERARDRARAAGDVSLEARAIGIVGASGFHGRQPWAEVERYGRAVVADADRLGPIAFEATAGIAGAVAYQGRIEEARALYEEHAGRLRERGQSFYVALEKQSRGAIELTAGDLERAEQLLRECWEELGATGERGFRSTCGALLARVLATTGRSADAIEVVEQAESLCSPDDWVTISYALVARAQVASAAGDHDDAVSLGRRAVEACDLPGEVHTRSGVLLEYGRLLVAAGADDARDVLGEALRLAEIKETKPYIEEARRLLELLSVGAP